MEHCVPWPVAAPSGEPPIRLPTDAHGGLSMPIAAGWKLKTMIDRTMRSTFLSLNRPLPVLVPARTKMIHAGDNVLLRPASPAQQAELGDDGNAPRPEIEPPASHADEETPRPSEASDGLVSSEINPLPDLLEKLGELIDGDTLAELVTVMAEVEEREAHALIAGMRKRIERRLTDEGMRKKAAASHVNQLAQRIADAWTTLHRRKDRT
jgi:hypothetical protein